MRVFKSAWFGRFARKEKISAEVLWEAVDRAEKCCEMVGSDLLEAKRHALLKANGFEVNVGIE